MSDVADFQTAANNVVEKVFDSLKGIADLKADGATRLFFPDGIQLIYVKLSLLKGITIEAEISGAKQTIAPDIAEEVAEIETPS
jgi:hypothetical protein